MDLKNTDKPSVRVGIGCWIFNPSGDVLLGLRLGTHGHGTWAAPGGHLEFGETPTLCASRELFEETGITVPAQDFQFIGITNDIFSDKHYVTLHYSAKNITATPKIMEPTKCAKWQWFNPSKLPTPLFLSAQNLLSTHPRF